MSLVYVKVPRVFIWIRFNQVSKGNAQSIEYK